MPVLRHRADGGSGRGGRFGLCFATQRDNAAAAPPSLPDSDDDAARIRCHPACAAGNGDRLPEPNAGHKHRLSDWNRRRHGIADRIAEFDGDADGYANLYLDGDSDGHRDEYADIHTNCDTDRYADEHPNRDANGYPDVNTHRDSDGNIDGHPDGDANIHLNRHAHLDADGDNRRATTAGTCAIDAATADSHAYALRRVSASGRPVASNVV